jgi:hypothetical protein
MTKNEKIVMKLGEKFTQKDKKFYNLYLSFTNL